jgi:hypothetical protein
MDFCKKLISSCLTGRGRSAVAVFLAVLDCVRAYRAAAGRRHSLGPLR